MKCAKSIEINLLTRLNLCMSPPRVALSSELHLATTFFTYTIPDSTRICNSILLSNENEEHFLSYDKSSRVIKTITDWFHLRNSIWMIVF